MVDKGERKERKGEEEGGDGHELARCAFGMYDLRVTLTRSSQASISSFTSSTTPGAKIIRKKERRKEERWKRRRERGREREGRKEGEERCAHT